MIVDGTDLDPESAYKLLIGGIIPRAIAWVSTRSTDGVDNLAPVSFFTAVGRKPPKVSLSLQPRSDGVTLKDTFVNIRDTGEFVTNMTTLPQAAQVHKAAFEFDPGIDEFAALGLGKEPCEVVRARPGRRLGRRILTRRRGPLSRSRRPGASRLGST